MTDDKKTEITFAVPTYQQNIAVLSTARTKRRHAQHAARAARLKARQDAADIRKQNNDKAAPFRLKALEATKLASITRAEACRARDEASLYIGDGRMSDAGRRAAGRANKAASAARKAERDERAAIRALKACYPVSPATALRLARRKEADRVAYRRKLMEKITDPAVVQLVESGTSYEHIDPEARLPLALYMHNAGASPLFIGEIFGIHYFSAQALVDRAKRERARSLTNRAA